MHYLDQYPLDLTLQAWADKGGRKNPPSAPPAIPPIVIDPLVNPLSGHIPSPSIDPLHPLPGPPIVPPPAPNMRMVG